MSCFGRAIMQRGKEKNKRSIIKLPMSGRNRGVPCTRPLLVKVTAYRHTGETKISVCMYIPYSQRTTVYVLLVCRARAAALPSTRRGRHFCALELWWSGVVEGQEPLHSQHSKRKGAARSETIEMVAVRSCSRSQVLELEMLLVLL